MFLNNKMKFKCEDCGIEVSTQNFLDEHIAGKKHQHNLELQQLARRSVYINNFKGTIDEQLLSQQMGQFGEVDRVLPDKSGKNAFAIVEYKEADAAQNLLHSVQRLKIGKSMVRIKPRIVDFGGPVSTQIANLELQNQVFASEVFDCLSLAVQGINAQIDSLYSRFSISADSIGQRNKFALSLQEHFQKFFSSQIHIRVFGSTLNGLGLRNSDLDLNFVFHEDMELENTVQTDLFAHKIRPLSSDLRTSSMELDSHDTPEELLTNPMDRSLFLKHSKNSRVRLLNQLINLFRKEYNLISAHAPVVDARTPVVRILLRNPVGQGPTLPCELSVQNLFGEFKANLIEKLVKAETTRTLLRLIFFIKLWAGANWLFSSDPNGRIKQHQQKGHQQSLSSNDVDQKLANQQPPNFHWNSYTLSLCMVAFLQSRNVIPSIASLIPTNSSTISCWPVSYTVLPFSLTESIPILLKAFFTFLHQQLKEQRVIVLRDAKIMDVKEFKEKYVDKDERIAKNWRFSVVNVQDPLELSHNVAANVSKESLGKLRWKTMFAISFLKKNPESIAPLFHLENVEKLKAEGRVAKRQIHQPGVENMEVD